MNIQNLKLSDIRIDGGTQSRVAINVDAVDEYAEALTTGATFPPVLVFWDGASYWLADGFHRIHANRKIGAVSLDADIRPGTQRDAQLFSFAANKTHGLRRTNEDKRKAVVGMLALVPDWSDRAISRHVGVNEKTVAAHRTPICGNSADAQTTRTVERGGKTYTQDVSGQKKAGEAKRADRPSNEAPKQTKPVLSIVPQMTAEDELDELRATNTELLHDNDRLSDRLAVAAMQATDEEKAAAADTISGLRAEVATLQRDLRAVKSTRDGLMVENAELKKSVAYWRKQAEKASA